MANKSTFPEVLWAGTDHSLSMAEEAYAKLMAGPYDGMPNKAQADVPDLLDVQGDIGVIHISGPLTNAAWSWSGTSYSEIRDALVYAAKDEAIKCIVLDIDSGGGAVSGVQDTADLISAVCKIKSVVAYTGGSMCSAAYWLGCSADAVYASSTATVGSVGVIYTHVEQSKALRDAGYGVTVMRAGEYKALASNVEPLSDAAKAQIMDQLNAAYQVFLGHVADNRGMTMNLADQKIGQGRVFFGEQGVGVGAIDGVMSFDDVMSICEKKSQNSGHMAAFPRGSNMKTALTDQQIAALAAGAAASAAAPVAAAAEVAVPNGDGISAEPAAVAPAAAAVEAEGVAAPAAVAPAAAPAEASLVTYLQGQSKEKDEAIFALRTELAQAQAKVAGMEATHSQLVAIAGQSLKNMKVALNFSAEGVQGLSAEMLLAEHASATESFNKAFKSGGVAAVAAASEDEPKKSEALDPMFAARVAAARASRVKAQ